MPPVVPSANTLFLPLRECKSAWLATLLLFAYYVAGMARDLSLYDSGELALAAVQLGLGHPPGQPLHTLFGFLCTQLPFVSPLVGVGLGSAIPAALCVLPATSLAQSLAPAGTPSMLLRATPWFLAGAALHAASWELATRVEVYALATFFAVFALARLAKPEGAAARTPRDVLIAGVLLGLSASANPMIAACAGLAVAPGILQDIVRKSLPLRALPLAILGGVLGVLPYVYVIAVAHRRDVMIWGAPRDVPSFVHYMLLRDYVANHEVTLALLGSHLFAWLVYGVQHFLLVTVVLGLVAHALFAKRAQLGGATLPILMALTLFNMSFKVVWDVEVPDFLAYFAPVLWLALAGTCALIAHAYLEGRKLAAWVLACSVLLSGLVAEPSVFTRTRSHDHLARSLAQRALAEAPPGAILIAEVDHIAGALLYLQEAEHARPDVIVLAYGLASSSWHWERILRVHPELRAFALRGPGGKPARVRRFLEANAARAVLVERMQTAEELGLRACSAGLYLRTGAACTPDVQPDMQVPALLSRTLETLGNGSPGAASAIAQAAFSLGEAHWRSGHVRAAAIAFLSGVPRAMQPTLPLHAAAALASAPALPAALRGFERDAALGEPARNLFAVGLIYASIRDEASAGAYLKAAAEDGLPEARALLGLSP